MKFCLLISTFLLFACTDAAKNNNGSRGGPRDGSDTRRPPISVKDSANVYRAQVFRDKGQKQLSYVEITKEVISATTDTEFRLIPDVSSDYESRVNTLNRPSKNCGINPMVETLKGRIANCNNINQETSFWSGKANGISGEGDWSLVYNKDGFTVWVDETTGLLWTSAVDIGNWNEASGANKNDNYFCGKLDFIPEDQVKWFLPSRSDFLQADVNGARFVLEGINNNEIYWTSTKIDRSARAWAIKQGTGQLQETDSNFDLMVRCVGLALK